MEEKNGMVKIRENVGKVIVGKEKVLELLLTALTAGGHVLLEDVPGTGKHDVAEIPGPLHGREILPHSVYAGSAAL